MKIARILVFLLAALAGSAHAERIKDLATVQGVRINQLVGYGLVVGLDGTGDQTTQTPFTVQSLVSMLSQLGVSLPPGTSLQLKNVAAVSLTATLPPYARPGQPLDVTIASIGNAKSLRGGTLLMSPLKGADGQVYAVAQGNVLVGGAGASAGGSSVQVNHLAAGRIPAGATVERAVATPLGQGPYVNLEVKEADFGTVSRIVDAINREFPDRAVALDGRQVRVLAPSDPSERVAFLGRIEGMSVTPAEAAAKVIVNARTGSVVMNRQVALENCAVAHGKLAVTVNTQTAVSQPNALSQGQTVTTQSSQIEISSEKGQLVVLPGAASLGDVVKALNAVGATPQDLLAILQAMKAAGALRAELEII